MKIESAESWRETIPLKRPYSISDRTVTGVEILFLRLRADDGSVGLGSASPSPSVTGETREACAQALDRENLGLLEGEDIRHLGDLLRRVTGAMHRTPAARAALDMALHDLFARHLDVSLLDFLGGRRKPRLTSVTLGIQGVDETLEEADHYLRQGFRCLKVKIGRDPEEDLERLERLRENWPWVRLRVDANRGYDTSATSTLGDAVSRLGLELVEQPMPVAELEATRHLPATLRRHLAADESLVNEEDALPLLERPRPYGIFNIKLMKCGGLFPGLRIAALAETAGIELMWGCMDESRISITAALHAAAASPATRYLDLDGSFELAQDPAQGGFTIEEGCLVPLDDPGLGVTLGDS